MELRNLSRQFSTMDKTLIFLWGNKREVRVSVRSSATFSPLSRGLGLKLLRKPIAELCGTLRNSYCDKVPQKFRSHFRGSEHSSRCRVATWLSRLSPLSLKSAHALAARTNCLLPHVFERQPLLDVCNTI